MTGPLADVINRTKFYLNGVRVFDSVGGSNFWLSHKKEKSPLTQGLNYHSACDMNHSVCQCGCLTENVGQKMCIFLSARGPL